MEQLRPLWGSVFPFDNRAGECAKKEHTFFPLSAASIAKRCRGEGVIWWRGPFSVTIYSPREAVYLSRLDLMAMWWRHITSLFVGRRRPLAAPRPIRKLGEKHSQRQLHQKLCNKGTSVSFSIC